MATFLSFEPANQVDQRLWKGTIKLPRALEGNDQVIKDNPRFLIPVANTSMAICK